MNVRHNTSLSDNNAHIITKFSQFIVVDATISDHIIMVLTPTLVDGLWYSLVAVVLSQGPILAALQKRGQIVNRMTGTLLILLALRVVMR